jgi:hypothetical protein
MNLFATPSVTRGLVGSPVLRASNITTQRGEDLKPCHNGDRTPRSTLLRATREISFLKTQRSLIANSKGYKRNMFWICRWLSSGMLHLAFT